MYWRKNTDKMKPNRRLYIIVVTLVGLFPTVANLFKNMGSGFLIVFTLVGIWALIHKPHPSFVREEKWLMTAFAAYLGVYLLSGLIHSMTGLLPDLRGKHFEKEAYLITFIPLVFLFRKIVIPRWIWWVAISLGSIFAGCYALIDFGWIDISYRVRGAYNPIMFGCLSLTMAFMAIQGYRFFKHLHPMATLIPLSGFFLGTVSSILTGSRGAWIAIPAFLSITLWHLGRNLRRLELALITTTFVVALVVAYHIPQTGVAKRVRFAQNDLKRYAQGDVTLDNSVGLRLASWEASLEMVKDHLLLGIGPGAYQPTINQLVKKDKLPYKAEIYHSQPHSIYFAVLVDAGLIGLVILLTVFLLPLSLMIQRIREKKRESGPAYAGVILTIGYMHFGLTETIFGRNLFVAFYVILLAILMTLTANRHTDNQPDPKIKQQYRRSLGTAYQKAK